VQYFCENSLLNVDEELKIATLFHTSGTTTVASPGNPAEVAIKTVACTFVFLYLVMVDLHVRCVSTVVVLLVGADNILFCHDMNKLHINL